MSQHAVGLTRRQAVRLLGVSSTVTAFPLAPGSGRASAATPTAAPAAGPVCDTYYRAPLSLDGRTHSGAVQLSARGALLIGRTGSEYRRGRANDFLYDFAHSRTS
jgi:hypothetical protein